MSGARYHNQNNNEKSSEFFEEEYEEDYELDGIPFCCLACGGPYPNCTDSCRLFDD